jgi:hypothetical protein
MPLDRCATCARHVRRSDAACPFCRTKRSLVVAAASAVIAATMHGCIGGVYGGPPAPVKGGSPSDDTRGGGVAEPAPDGGAPGAVDRVPPTPKGTPD